MRRSNAISAQNASLQSPSNAKPSARAKLFQALLAVIVAASMSTVACVNPEPAYSDELSDAKAELSEQVEKLDELKAKIDELNAQIDEKASAAVALEEEIQQKQQTIAKMTVFFYKNPSSRLIEFMLASESISQAINRAEFLYDYTKDLAKAAKQQREMDAQLHDDIASISDQKDEQLAAQAELQAVVDELQAKVDKLTAEQRAKLAAGTTFVTNFDDDMGEWHSGVASAYGGSTDSAGSTTATGAHVDDYSMGVAIPMSWPNFRSYFNRKIEISYNGKSVVAVVNDCGSMGGGSRSLDLQPGVFKALGGVSSCDGWGLRTVKYRFL